MAARLQRNIEVCTCQIFFASCKSISFCMKFPVSFMAASRHCFSIFYHHAANHWIGRRMTHSCFRQVQRLLHILFCFCHPDSPFCRHDDGCPNTKARTLRVFDAHRRDSRHIFVGCLKQRGTHSSRLRRSSS